MKRYRPHPRQLELLRALERGSLFFVNGAAWRGWRPILFPNELPPEPLPLARAARERLRALYPLGESGSGGDGTGGAESR